MIVRRFSTRAEGDFSVDADPAQLCDLRRAHHPGTWTWLRQVHGADVVTVTEPGAGAGSRADAAVTAVPDAVLAIHTADCVPVLFADAATGVVGASHAGWRGLAAGVLDATVDAMVALGAIAPTAEVGPHIRAACYEFGASDLDDVAAVCGDEVRATTAAGTPALDLTRAVESRLRAIGVAWADTGACTACDDAYFSHRARGERGRMAATVSRRSA